MKICSRIAEKAKIRAARKRTPVDLGKAVKLGKSTQQFGILLALCSHKPDFQEDLIRVRDDYDESEIEWTFPW